MQILCKFLNFLLPLKKVYSFPEFTEISPVFDLQSLLPYFLPDGSESGVACGVFLCQKKKLKAIDIAFSQIIQYYEIIRKQEAILCLN